MQSHQRAEIEFRLLHVESTEAMVNVWSDVLNAISAPKAGNLKELGLSGKAEHIPASALYHFLANSKQLEVIQISAGNVISDILGQDGQDNQTIILPRLNRLKFVGVTITDKPDSRSGVGAADAEVLCRSLERRKVVGHPLVWLSVVQNCRVSVSEEISGRLCASVVHPVGYFGGGPSCMEPS